MTTDETVPMTCMADGCDAPLTVTGWISKTVPTAEPGQKIVNERAPRRQLAQCTGDAHHEFERHEGFDWAASR
jgi:hypothetical protein